MKKLFSFSVIAVLLTGCDNTDAQIRIEPAFPNLTFQQPVDLQNAGDGSNRLFVLEQRGIIYVFPNSSATVSKKIFLDLTDKVSSGGEMGLLGLAFHPDYKNNGYFYVDYTVNSPTRRTIISRFRIGTDPDKADKSSELILMQIEQPYSNHNGGQISFGPDSFLYISLGDGGSGGDPQNNAQNLKSLLGKILRINIDKIEPGRNYSIPSDNPFKGNPSGYREEIYAYGLRNVWRFSFDNITKYLWGADVGQNAWEEINLIEKGGNYGWRCYEGNHSYNTSDCNSSNYIKPIWEYGHNTEGGYSITGGFVYRGKSAGELTGKYIYGDFVSGTIWSLEYSDNNAKNSLLFRGSNAVSTFGVDEGNELYFTNYSNGRIYKFTGTPVTKVGTLDLPTKFHLGQNYPNPFNPSTIISYQISQAGNVSLKVFDVLGREVAILVDEFRLAGNYSSTFSTLPSSLSNGVYFYQLISSNYVETKKLSLIK